MTEGDRFPHTDGGGGDGPHPDSVYETVPTEPRIGGSTEITSDGQIGSESIPRESGYPGTMITSHRGQWYLRLSRD